MTIIVQMLELALLPALIAIAGFLVRRLSLRSITTVYVSQSGTREEISKSQISIPAGMPEAEQTAYVRDQVQRIVDAAYQAPAKPVTATPGV
jgi:hypothetical protein